MTHGLLGRWIFLSRTLPDIGGLLSPLEQGIRLHLLPSLTGKSIFSDAERQLISLPSRLGGLDQFMILVYLLLFSLTLHNDDWSLSVTTFGAAVFPDNVLNEQLALKQEIHLENRCRC